MRLLNGSELAGYIKERQAHQVRGLRQAEGIVPKLAIVCNGENPVIDVYLKLKQQYGEDILVDVDVYRLTDEQLLPKIDELNADKKVHGIIVQLPLENTTLTDEVLARVDPAKDVDGLNPVTTDFSPATAMAIDWLVNGYNVDLINKKIVIVGFGRLVGAPLAKMWQNGKYDVTVCDINTEDLAAETVQADILVTATGVPGLIKSDMIKQKAVVVDAGTASEEGKIVGDLAADVREREDLAITPIKGGVGPLTVAALFDNVILAAIKRAK